MLGNGLIDQRHYDLQGRLANQSLGSVDTRTYLYDKNSNIVNRNTTPQNSVYSYDAMDRLLSEGINAATPLTYRYDLNGNRKSRNQGIKKTQSYVYKPGSNALKSTDTFQQGSTLLAGLANKTITYNNVNRMSQLFQAGQLKASYIYNAQGQRTRKTIELTGGGQRITIYHYNRNGQLISETTETGVLIRDYIWQNGMPIAQVDSTPASETLTFLHTDHLSSPRIATNTAGSVVWRWDGEAFGSTQPNEIAGITINLRFAGQYYDVESGLHYNYFRDYDPQTGRYLQSDPIGLAGGLNTYGYVGENPLSFRDASGLRYSPYEHGRDWDGNVVRKI